ncbi:hypothetical protein AB0E02_15035, partial [Streptomyces sp. NPDC048196]
MTAPDQVARLRVLAAGLRAPLYAEARIALPFDRVWAVIADLEGELPHLISFVREFRVPPGDSEHKAAQAEDVLGRRGPVDVRLSTGWWLIG